VSTPCHTPNWNSQSFTIILLLLNLFFSQFRAAKKLTLANQVTVLFWSKFICFVLLVPFFLQPQQKKKNQQKTKKKKKKKCCNPKIVYVCCNNTSTPFSLTQVNAGQFALFCFITVIKLTLQRF
jgi:hypothetical protein